MKLLVRDSFLLIRKGYGIVGSALRSVTKDSVVDVGVLGNLIQLGVRRSENFHFEGRIGGAGWEERRYIPNRLMEVMPCRCSTQLVRLRHVDP